MNFDVVDIIKSGYNILQYNTVMQPLQEYRSNFALTQDNLYPYIAVWYFMGVLEKTQHVIMKLDSIKRMIFFYWSSMQCSCY